MCILVYKSVPSTALALRSYLSSAVASQAQQLVEDAAFLETALRIPELLRDIIFSLVRQYQVTCDKRDAAIASSLKAEEAVMEANKRGQEDKVRVVAQVNNPRRCRHCSLENNVFFEPEVASDDLDGIPMSCVRDCDRLLLLARLTIRS